jgi:hemoglobin
MDLLDTHLYALLGADYFNRLVTAFYRRVRTDDILGPMYPKKDMAGAEQRLGQFLIQRFGGPQTYSEQRGHPRLRMRHAAFHVDSNARDRWVSLMSAALDEVETPQAARPLLDRFFADAATFMINRGHA